MSLANAHASVVEHLISYSDRFFPGEVKVKNKVVRDTLDRFNIVILFLPRLIIMPRTRELCMPGSYYHHPPSMVDSLTKVMKVLFKICGKRLLWSFYPVVDAKEEEKTHRRMGSTEGLVDPRQQMPSGYTSSENR